MQKATIAVLMAVLLAVPASAAPPAGPLPPAGPAGAKAAQLTNNETLFIGAAVLVIGLGLYLASGNYKLPGGSAGGSGGGTTNTPPPTTTTTATTTTR